MSPCNLDTRSPGHQAIKRGPWLLLALALAVTIGLTGRALLSSPDPTWARIQQTGVWRVGMDPSFPPFEDLDSATGEPIGFDVDLVRVIAARWGVRPEIVGVGFDQLIDAVAAHRVDSAVSALPVFDHRAREVSFSIPYLEAGIVLAVPSGSPIREVTDLAGRRVAAEWGSAGDAEARALQKRLDGNLELVLRESVAEALEAVVAGDADAASVDAVSLALFDRAGAQLAPMGEPLRSDPYVIVVPADAPQLLAALNDALAALAADGALAGLKTRWLGVNMP
jgi:polar amino acid transport system substrate-binding protein